MMMMEMDDDDDDDDRNGWWYCDWKKLSGEFFSRTNVFLGMF